MSPEILKLPASHFNRAGLSAASKSFSALLNSADEGEWTPVTIVALFALVLLWATQVATTWASWGNLTVDCGREMYVPWALAQGKQLYRDVWFLNGPVAPYFNSYLFRLFGFHLNVLYWAGSLAAFGSGLFLYLAGMRVGSWLSGWVAAAVIFLEAFQPSLFCFPLPYSFSTVYGCLIACCLLWVSVRAATSPGRLWIFAAGLAAAVALLDKLEMGATCYAALALLMAGRALMQRSWTSFLKDCAVTLPGVILFALITGWMISIKGFDFITQENFLSWPTAYFMKNYGKFWLASTGFSFDGQAFAEGAWRTAILLGVLQGGHLFVTWKRTRARWKAMRLAVLVTAIALLVAALPGRDWLRSVFFPQDMVLYAATAAPVAWWYFWRDRSAHQSLRLALVFSFAFLLAFRILFRTLPSGYPIYYNGPAVLSFFLLLRMAIRHSVESRRLALATQLVFSLAALISIFLYVGQQSRHSKDYQPMITDRGMIRTWPDMANNYGDAIAFIKAKNALGELVLSVPEDTSLYFLAGVECPLRVYQFTPGAVAPGKMTNEVIAEIERKNIRYLLWSSRIFPEYGVPRFGIDFNQDLGSYLRSHYRLVGSVVRDPITPGEWTAFVWERQADAKNP